MRYIKPLLLLAGLALLGLVIREMDLQDLMRQVNGVGTGGMAFVLALYSLTFMTDVAGWQLTLKGVPLDLRWLQRLYLVRMTGEAFNNVTPFGAMGGEPVKALLLKTHYGIRFRDSGVSLILAKTIILIALILFLGIGFALLLPSERLQGYHKTLAGLGLVALGCSIALFFLVQRLRLTSCVARLFGGSALAAKLEGLLKIVHEVEDRLAQFYSEHRARFGGALSLAFANWFLGAVEVYAVMQFLGHPVSLADAWAIEAMAQLVRAGTSFIPASIGAQEGALVLASTAMTGSGTLGLALSVIRRFRELIWIVGGLGLWWLYSFNSGGIVARVEPEEA